MHALRVTGPIHDFLHRDIDEVTEAEAWLFTPERPGLVLGSAQAETVADLTAAEASSIDVVRRRSGGGAVFVDPERSLWLDVVVPRTDARWDDDVRASTYWLGEAWQRALAEVGVDGEVFRDGVETTPWGRLVCFGSLGPGEVVRDGRKIVGISQRRTRAGARFQCIVYADWDPYEVLDLLHLDPDARSEAGADLVTRARGIGPRLADLEAAILAEISSMS